MKQIGVRGSLLSLQRLTNYLRVSSSLSVCFQMVHVINTTAVARQNLLIEVLGLMVIPKAGVAITT